MNLNGNSMTILKPLNYKKLDIFQKEPHTRQRHFVYLFQLKFHSRSKTAKQNYRPQLAGPVFAIQHCDEYNSYVTILFKYIQLLPGLGCSVFFQSENTILISAWPD